MSITHAGTVPLRAVAVRREVVKLAPADLAFRLRSNLSDSPFAPALAWARAQERLAPTRLSGVDLVVDGFPRSATTFVRALLEEADASLRIGSHAHSARYVTRAAARGVPTLVLVRRPGPAAAALLEQRPALSPSTALDAWERYYATVRGSVGQLEIGTFAEVVVAPAAVLARVDARFGTAFADLPLRREPDHAVIARISAQAAGRSRLRVGSGVSLPVAGAGPESVAETWSAPDRRRLEQLDRVYGELVAAASEA